MICMTWQRELRNLGEGRGKCRQPQNGLEEAGVIPTTTHQFWPICWLDCFAHFIHSFFSYFLSFHYLGGGCSPSTFVRGLCPRPPCFRHLCCFMHVISCKFMTLRMINKTLFWYSRCRSVWPGSGSSRICGRVRGLRRQPKMGGGRGNSHDNLSVLTYFLTGWTVLLILFDFSFVSVKFRLYFCLVH